MICSRIKASAIVWSLPIFVCAMFPPQGAQARNITTPTVKMPPVHVKTPPVHVTTPPVHATGAGSIPLSHLSGSHHIGVNKAFYHPKQISAKGNFGGGSGSPSTGTACQVVQLCVPNIITGTTQCSSQTVCK